jgi:hypothetical protein
MESGLFLIATVALALVLWIYAIRLLRQIYRKCREDLRRITRREAALPLRAPVSFFSKACQWTRGKLTPAPGQPMVGETSAENVKLLQKLARPNE